MKSVFIAWQDKITRCWHPVAKLTYDDIRNVYRLNYTLGAVENPRFKKFSHLDDINKVYESEEIFPFFRNRLVNKNRAEYKNILEWLDIDDEESAIDILSITGAERSTDNFRVIPHPQKHSLSEYRIDFLCNGISHLSESERNNIQTLNTETKIGYKLESHPYDKNAVALFDSEKGMKIGYCPRYLSSDISYLINHNEIREKIFSIKKVNPSAPYQYKLLCTFKTEWPTDFIPNMSHEYLAVSEIKRIKKGHPQT
ncbi:MAG: HIRAN domain-containing protein [Alcanivorax sp.]|uniref:HIRAN domain-containing protein n=1 Tax=Alcanivorax sp. TaxID=1872427 RepID=UPI003DA7184F